MCDHLKRYPHPIRALIRWAHPLPFSRDPRSLKPRHHNGYHLSPHLHNRPAGVRALRPPRCLGRVARHCWALVGTAHNPQSGREFHVRGLHRTTATTVTEHKRRRSQSTRVPQLQRHTERRPRSPAAGAAAADAEQHLLSPSTAAAATVQHGGVRTDTDRGSVHSQRVSGLGQLATHR